MTLRLESRFERLGEAEHHWRVWLSGPPDELKAVQQLTYRPDSAHGSQGKTVTSRRTAFQTEVPATTEFEIRATARLKDGHECELSHPLRFGAGWRVSENVSKARQTLRGSQVVGDTKTGPLALLELAKALKHEREFGFARRLLANARSQSLTDLAAEDRVKLGQQHALCTYKDPDLPPDQRLDDAFEILREVDDPKTTQNQETLGLCGAIFKRHWEVDAREQHLERSLAYYQRGYDEGAASDGGYTGINAAYVLDLLAHLEQREAEQSCHPSSTAAQRRDEARKIREDLIATLPPLAKLEGKQWLKQEWWYYVTVAEAYFGLQEYGNATTWLTDAGKLQKVAAWEYETTARQLASLARLQSESAEADVVEDSPAWQVLRTFLKDDATAVRSAVMGKVGLALSGGGFRASLFHIGVLAKLAELDVLRHVEVLSCVSGGSILGAYYYLELRRLLQEKSDSQVTRQDYVDVVQRVQRRFMEGVQRNIRTRVAGNLKKNLQMLFSRTYSRTVRAGELFESELYSLIEDEPGDKRWINDSFVMPKDDDSFKMKYDNWRRANKVPMLILNATTLNTGHNWQFTASWMGESPVSINTEIDKNERLRRMYYWESPPQHDQVRLGVAVGSSAAVPGVFEPIALPDLYPGKTVRLVDGGVYDNQGIAGLLEQDCSILLVSDASGQVSTQDQPGSDVLSVLLRSNETSMGRVRCAEHDGVEMRERAGLVRGLMFVHLKMDLESATVDWTDCDDPHAASEGLPLTKYGILKEAQALIAAIRTDLDSFNDTESYALMLSGYRQAAHTFAHELIGLGHPMQEPPMWDFFEIQDGLTKPHEFTKIRPLLQVARKRAFKVWHLVPALKHSAVVGAVLLAALLGWLAWRFWDTALLNVTVGQVAITVIVLCVTWALGKWAWNSIRYRDTLERVVSGVAMCLVGWLAVWVHLWLFDRWYLAKGRVPRKPKVTATGDGEAPNSPG